MRTTPEISRGLRAAFVLFLGAATACSGLKLGSRPQTSEGPQRPGTARTPGSTPSGVSRTDSVPAGINVVDFNRRLGLIANGAPMPFYGSVFYLAGPTSDSANALVALTLQPSALVFRREGDQHRADYRVMLLLKRGEATIARVETVEAVRVASVREAGSSEFSVIFQQLMTTAPGAYTLFVSVTDEASGKKGSVEVGLQMPAAGTRAVSSPIAFFDLAPRISTDSVPRIVSNPRATFTFARDTTADFYIEAYGSPSGSRIGAAVQVEGVTIWSDSVALRGNDPALSTAVVRIPVTRFAPGLAQLVAWIPGRTDTIKTPFFISYGEPVPATTFADMIGYLRYFASEARLRPLLATTPQARGLAWANFYRETDPNSATMPSEALNAYLERLRYVDAQFTEGGVPGWKTDRGMVYLLFGQYDVALDPFGASPERGERGRSLQWEYRGQGLSIEFTRTGSFGPWRLTPESEQAVRAAARKLLGGDILK